jgi:sucrose phosphorylase
MAETGRNRSINRAKLDAATVRAELDDPSTLRHRVFTGIDRLLRARAAEPTLHPDAGQRVLDGDPGLVLIERCTAGRRLLAVVNVTPEPCALLAESRGWTDIVADEGLSGPEIAMPPFAVRWLVERVSAA